MHLTEFIADFNSLADWEQAAEKARRYFELVLFDNKLQRFRQNPTNFLNVLWKCRFKDIADFWVKLGFGNGQLLSWIVSFIISGNLPRNPELIGKILDAILETVDIEDQKYLGNGGWWTFSLRLILKLDDIPQEKLDRLVFKFADLAAEQLETGEHQPDYACLISLLRSEKLSEQALKYIMETIGRSLWRPDLAARTGWNKLPQFPVWGKMSKFDRQVYLIQAHLAAD